MTHDDYVNALKSHLKKIVVKQVVKFIFSKLTFLAWGPLAPIVNFLVGKIISIAINQTELAIFIKYIDIRTTKQGRDFYSAIEMNEQAKIGGNKDEQEKSEEKLKDTFRDFIRLTN